jgi:hypothetical protein
MSRSTIQLDPLVVHSDDLGEIVGSFYGTPVRLWYPEETSLRDRIDGYRVIMENKQVRQ